MIEQRVDERAGIILVRRMRDHARRFIHHKEILVFVDDIERNVFRKDFRRFRFGKFYLDDLARNYCMAGFHPLSAHNDFAIADCLLHFRARSVFNVRRQIHIEPLFFCPAGTTISNFRFIEESAHT